MLSEGPIFHFCSFVPLPEVTRRDQTEIRTRSQLKCKQKRSKREQNKRASKRGQRSKQPHANQKTNGKERAAAKKYEPTFIDFNVCRVGLIRAHCALLLMKFPLARKRGGEDDEGAGECMDESGTSFLLSESKRHGSNQERTQSSSS